jgi:hypothetical protein
MIEVNFFERMQLQVFPTLPRLEHKKVASLAKQPSDWNKTREEARQYNNNFNPKVPGLIASQQQCSMFRERPPVPVCRT